MKKKIFVDFQRNDNFNNEEMIAKYRETYDPKIREEIIINNMPLVMYIMKEYENTLNSINSYADLVSVGYLALIKAVDQYDGSKSLFSTYAGTAIRNNITRAIHILEGENSTEHYGRKIAKYRYLATKIFGTSDVIYDQENMDYVLNLMLEQKLITKDDFFPMRLNLHSISQLATQEEIENVREEVDTSSSEPVEFIRAYYDELFKTLNEREQYIIKYRYGLIDGKEHTLKEIGKQLGMSWQAVQQQERKCLTRMKNKVEHYR